MQVVLNWQPVSGATLYKVYRGLFTGGPYDLIGSTVGVTWTDSSDQLVNGQDYFYTVSAITPDGESSYSTEFTATAPAQPASPLSLTGVVT